MKTKFLIAAMLLAGQAYAEKPKNKINFDQRLDRLQATQEAEKKSLKDLTRTIETKDFNKDMATPALGGHDGNGGGGIKRNGQYMTFYSAGLYVERALSGNGLPEIDQLVDTISKMTFFGGTTQAKIIGAIVPNTKREYLKVQNFDNTIKARLLNEFSRVTGVNSKELELYAVTDTNTGQTFLLPNFFQLSSVDKMTILFHEAYWVMNPKSSYSQVVDAEMSFQAVLESPDNFDRSILFIEKVGSQSDRLRLLLAHDLAVKALNPLIKRNGEISMADLLGPEFVDCGGYRSCFPAALPYLQSLQQKLPNSFLIKQLIRSISLNEVSIVGDYKEEATYTNRIGRIRLSMKNRASGISGLELNTESCKKNYTFPNCGDDGIEDLNLMILF